MTPEGSGLAEGRGLAGGPWGDPGTVTGPSDKERVPSAGKGAFGFFLFCFVYDLGAACMLLTFRTSIFQGFFLQHTEVLRLGV